MNDNEHRETQGAAPAVPALFQQFIDSSTERMALLDPRGAYLAANAAYAATFQTTPRGLAGRNIEDFWSGFEGWPAIQGHFARALAGEQVVVRCWLAWPCPAGRAFLEVIWAPVRGGDGAVTAVSLITRDLSEERLAQEALRESEKRFQALFEGAGDAMFLVDEQAHIRAVNRQACESLGYSREELLNLSVMDVDPIYDTPDRAVGSLRHVGGMGAGTLETRHRRKDGSEFPVEVRMTVVEVGGTGHVLGAVRDISARKAAEEALRRARDEAEAASMAKGLFLANLSHEVRTPLNGVLGTLQLLGMTALSPEQNEYVETALYSSRLLLSVLNDILDYTRIESGRLRITSEPFAPFQLLEAARALFAAQAALRRVNFRMEAAEDLPLRVLGDESRLRQILFNLVGNAVKFTESGEVTVEARAARRPDGRVNLLLVVSDTGPGIPPEFLPNLFRPFAQAESRSRGQGSGLGLAIVKRLAELMGGSLCLDTVPGEGTRFVVAVPVEALAEDEPRAGDPGSGGGRLRILLAEDDRVSRLPVQRMLERRGHTVLGARDGSEVLATLAGERVDCVLMDLSMPVVDGLEAARRIRAGDCGVLDPKVPILALTAQSTSDGEARAREAGMDGYVVKPVDLLELLKDIEVVLGRPV